MKKEIKTKWNIEADYFQACSCDYGCPCEFEAPPTRGFCQGVGAWRINRGKYGDVDLSGLGFGFSAHWPKAIHEGNGTLQLLLDGKANPKQKEALIKIASGEAGGMPFEIIVQTISKVLDPLSVPIEFKVNGKLSRVKMGDKVTMAFEPIKNPITGDEESVRIEHATGFIFQKAECVSNKVCESTVKELKFSWPDKCGFVTNVSYHN